MQRIWRTERRVHDAAEQPLLLTYDLLEAEAAYGIEVRMARGGVEESARAVAVSPDERRVKSLLSSLAEGTVTPCTLLEVLDERL